MNEKAGSRHVVMVVDDDSAILKLMKLRLEHRGFQVATSETGTEAIEAVQKLTPAQRDQILAVLLDLTLKEMSGLDVLQSIKKIHPNMPVIMVTGHHDEAEARRAISMGATDFLTKPVDFESLENLLRTLSAEGT